MSKPEHTRRPDALAGGDVASLAEDSPESGAEGAEVAARSAGAVPQQVDRSAGVSGERSGAAGAAEGVEAAEVTDRLGDNEVETSTDSDAEPPAEAGPAAAAAGGVSTVKPGGVSTEKADAAVVPAPRAEGDGAAAEEGGSDRSRPEPRTKPAPKSEPAPKPEVEPKSAPETDPASGSDARPATAAGEPPAREVTKEAPAGLPAPEAPKDAGTAAPVSVRKAAPAAATGRTGAVPGLAVSGNSTDHEGQLLAGRYRLGRVLGKGGMGTVWRAVDETLGRSVAVKELRFPGAIDEEEKRRLITRTLREAKAIARIRSGSAVTVFDVVHEDDRPWIVMELVEGSSLAEFIRERGTLTPRRAAEVGLAILDVLRAAHTQGILHRDVKPSNVLISETGRVVLTDFGIAQVEGDPSVTSTGMLVGAPSYISPERARGHKPGPPADLWSLGGLLYACVEGVPPYDKGSALATLTAVMTEPVDPPQHAGPLTEVIYGLLAKDPQQRLDDAGARALLTAVIDAPEEPTEPPADETRVVALPPLPEATADTGAHKAAEKAAERAAEKAAEKEARKAEKEARLAREREKREARERDKRERAKAALASVRAAAARTAEPPAGDPARPAGPRTAPAAPLTDVVPRRTIALAVVAVVAVLALIGGVIAYIVSGDDDEPGGKANGPDRTSSSGGPTPAESARGGSSGAAAQGGTDGKGATAGTGTGTGEGRGTGQEPGTDGGKGTGKGTGSGDGKGTALPAGYAQVTDTDFRFTMALPSDFRRTAIAGEKSGGIYNRAKGAFPRIQVDFNDSPLDDARLAWAQLAGAVARSSSGYKLIGISEQDYRGYPTVADWQFEREQGGQRIRILNRGFKVDADHGYAIMISCAVAEWDGPECRTLRETAFATFQPKG